MIADTFVILFLLVGTVAGVLYAENENKLNVS